MKEFWKKPYKREKNILKKFPTFFLLFFIFILVSGCSKKQKIEKEVEQEKAYQAKQLEEIEDFIISIGDSSGKTIYCLGNSKKKDKNNTEIEVIKVTRNKVGNKKITLPGTDNRKKTFFKKTNDRYLLLQKEKKGYQFFKFHEDGILEKSVFLSFNKNLEEKKIDLHSIQFSEQETIYALDDKGTFYCFQQDGKLEKIAKTEEKEVFDYMLLKDDSLYCIKNGTNEFKIYEYTINSLQTVKNEGTIKAILHTPKLSSTNSYFFLPNNNEQELYLYSSIGIYKYFPKSEETKLICKWTDSGIDGINILQVLSFTEEHFLVLEGELFSMSNPKQELYYLCPEEKTAKTEEKQILTLGILNQWIEIDEIVTEYNRQNEDSKIVIQEYWEKEDPVQAMHDDIVSGNAPDMIDMTPLNVKNYSKKELIVDLTELIHTDSEISEEIFVDNIIKALKVDGKLYFIPSWFDMNVLAGNSDTIQGRTSWTFQEFEQLYDKKDKDTLLFGIKTKENLLYEFSNSMLNGFIDWEKGKVNFKNKEFGSLLSFIKEFPENFYNFDTKLLKKMKNGNILFKELFLGTLDSEYCFYNQIFDHMELIGYPSAHGSGISANTIAPIIAITTSCKEKEKAFEFLKMFWTYDYQKKWSVMSFPFPTRKDVLEKKLEYASASKSYIDEDGQKVTAVSGTTSFNGIEVKKKPLKKKDIETILDFIDRIEWFDYQNSERKDIITIIAEEAQAYFDGDKTIEGVEDIIQSRVGIYLEERK